MQKSKKKQNNKIFGNWDNRFFSRLSFLMEVMQLELEKKVEEHEKRLDVHDRELGRLDKRTIAMQEQINSSLVRVDESNKFLREQNMKQMEQNSDILNAVLNRNSEHDQRQDEIKKINAENRWKLILGVAGASSLITVLLDFIRSFFQ